jgi:hypothetical protein
LFPATPPAADVQRRLQHLARLLVLALGQQHLPCLQQQREGALLAQQLTHDERRRGGLLLALALGAARGAAGGLRQDLLSALVQLAHVLLAAVVPLVTHKHACGGAAGEAGS